ncbi:MAG: AbrB/MazE/SpoVT family DNA-binding domain-containing protein [bacterium]
MNYPQPEFYGSTIVSDKGQVVIPVEARNVLGLEKGEKLLVMGIDEKGIMLMKVSAFEKISLEMAKKQKQINKIIESI